MSSDDWIEFSFSHQGELHVVYSSDDADEMMAAGALTADTRITAFLPEGSKVMVAKDLAQLPFAPPPAPPVEVAVEQAVEPEPTPVQSMRAGIMPYAPQPKERVVTPVSALFKTDKSGDVTAPPRPVGEAFGEAPPAWLTVPVWQQALHRTFDFKGRSSRLEYWSYIGVMVVGLVVGMTVLRGISKSLSEAFYILALIGLFVTNLSLGVRRLHDIGMSGWLLLIGIIPYLGTIALLILAAMPSSDGRNDYGEPSPR